MSAPELHLLTGAYAANALSPNEREEFRAHLAECDTCADEVRELQEVAAQLGSSLPTVSSPLLKERVLAEVSTTTQDLPERPVVSRLSRRRSRTVISLVAASVVALMVAAGASMVALDQHRQMTDEAGRSLAVRQVLTATDAQSFQASVAGGGAATVVMSVSKGKALFVGKALPAPPDGDVYRLWIVTADGRELPAGSFDPKAGAVVLPVAGDIHAATEVALTMQSSTDMKASMSRPLAMVDLGT